MIQAVGLSEKDNALEVGTGCGYAASVMSQIANKVYSTEIVRPLFESASKTIAELGYKNINLFYGDSLEPVKEFGPFDSILVTACAPFVPEELKESLSEGGRMVLPVQIPGALWGEQMLVKVTKQKEGVFTEDNLMMVRFVPLTGKSKLK
jgi:protein-L-isoaspartate(D-aspartate) O-methyltransferase